MLFVRQLAIFKMDAFALGKKRHFNRVRPDFGSSGSRTLSLFICHKSLLILQSQRPTTHDQRRFYSNSAFAIGCGAVGPSPVSASSIVLPFNAVVTAVSIINSACRVVPLFNASIALRITS